MLKRFSLVILVLFAAAIDAQAHGGRTFSRGYGGHCGVSYSSYGHCNNAVLQVPFVPTYQVAYYQPVQLVQYVQPVVQYVQPVQQVQYVQPQVQQPYIPPVQAVQEVQQPVAVQTYAAPQVVTYAAPVCPVPFAIASPCYGSSYAGSFAYSAFRSHGFHGHGHGFRGNSGFVRSRSNGNFQGRGGNVQINVPGVGISSRGGFVRSRR